MKHLIPLSFILFLFQSLQSQENIYNYVKLGKYGVGLMDTIIFDSNYAYEQFGYKGKKPYFIKIWHPTKKKAKNKYLKVKDLFVSKQNENLKTVQDSLESVYKKLFIHDYLSENLEDGLEIKYGSKSLNEIFDLIGTLETRSFYKSIKKKSDFPIVMYHNGSQGHPFENYLLAEYFASRGYIFIVASFELQFGNNPFGMLPYERFHSNEYEGSLRSIRSFAQTLTKSSNIFFIGHSMGAQMGLRTFDQDTTIKGMISLETSIEFKSDLEKIKEMWPELYKKIHIDHVYYPFPILFCAATGETRPFNFLNQVKAQQISYVSANAEFEHNAYLSLFYLRYFLDNSIEQADKYVIEKRLSIYIKHLELFYRFTESAQNKEEEKIKSILIQD